MVIDKLFLDRFSGSYSSKQEQIRESEENARYRELERRLHRSSLTDKDRTAIRDFSQELDQAFSTPERKAPNIIICTNGIVTYVNANAEGQIVKANLDMWEQIAKAIGDDFNVAFEMSSLQWEEIVAGAFDRQGFDEVTLTPRSGDHGRDVIAVKHGIGSIRVIGSVKAYKRENVVPYEHIRSLIGVLAGDQKASKGIITTTSDFPPHVLKDPFIAPFVPTRLELINGRDLQRWLRDLSSTNG